MLAPEDDGPTMDALRFSLASDIVELVVLTEDGAFLQTLREAVGETRRLWHVPSSDKVSDLPIAGGVGILVWMLSRCARPPGGTSPKSSVNFPIWSWWSPALANPKPRWRA